MYAGDPEDNYYFDAVTAQEVQIRLQLPGTLVGRTSVWLYAQGALRRTLCGTEEIKSVIYTASCHIDRGARYVVRIYTDGMTSNAHWYVLQVTYR